MVQTITMYSVIANICAYL